MRVSSFTVPDTLRLEVSFDAGATVCSIDFNMQRGRAPVGERLDPELKARLDTIDDALDRQIYWLGWLHRQFRKYLPDESIIRYESIVESGGKALQVVRTEANLLDEPLTSQNKSKLYDRDGIFRIGEWLLESEGAYWESYTKESVERLLDPATS